MWSYNHTPDPDELMHYGVRGMKWRKGTINPAVAVSLTRSGRSTDPSMRRRQKRAKKNYRTQLSNATKDWIKKDVDLYKKGRKAILNSKTQKDVDKAVKKTTRGYDKAGNKWLKKANKARSTYNAVRRGQSKEMATNAQRRKKKRK